MVKLAQKPVVRCRRRHQVVELTQADADEWGLEGRRVCTCTLHTLQASLQAQGLEPATKEALYLEAQARWGKALGPVRVVAQSAPPPPAVSPGYIEVMWHVDAVVAAVAAHLTVFGGGLDMGARARSQLAFFGRLLHGKGPAGRDALRAVLGMGGAAGVLAALKAPLGGAQ